jgi:glutamate dehydrogenase/leucine dehydrogenase
VIVSYLEWVQNREGAHWSEAEVNDKLKAYMERAVTQMVESAEQYHVPLKEAAFIGALRRLVEE